MPGRDGTGPLGQGAMTGRGLGICGSAGQRVYGRGLGMGYGLGRGYYCGRIVNPIYTDSTETLAQEKAVLEARLDAINKQINK